MSLLPMPGGAPLLYRSDIIAIVRRHRSVKDLRSQGPRTRDDAGHFFVVAFRRHAFPFDRSIEENS